MFNPFLKFGQPMNAADDGGTGGAGTDGTKGAEDTDPTKGAEDKTDKSKDENFIPKSRFDEVNTKFKEMKTQLDAFLATKEAEETEAKKKTGQFEDLYAQAKTDLEKSTADGTTSKGRVDTLEAIITTMLDAKLLTVPEEFRDLVPSGMAPEQKLEWLSQAEAKGLFGTTKKSDIPVGGSTNPTGKQNADFSKMNPLDLLKAAYSSTKK